jgi:hypothetical protein
VRQGKRLFVGNETSCLSSNPRSTLYQPLGILFKGLESKCQKWGQKPLAPSSMWVLNV